MEQKDFRTMQYPILVTYFEECVEWTRNNPEDVQAFMHKEEVKSHIVIQLGKLALL